MDRLMDRFCQNSAVAEAHRISWKSSNWLYHQYLTGLLQRSVTGCIWSFHTENNLITRSFTHAIVFGHIIVVASVRAYVSDVTTAINEQWRSMGRQKHSELHHQGEFLHN